MDVLNRILELRGEKGWSEYRLSVESGIPQSTISSWFRKKAQPSIASIEAICAACGITLSAFFAPDSLSGLTETQSALLSAAARLTPEQQKALFSFLSSL